MSKKRTTLQDFLDFPTLQGSLIIKKVSLKMLMGWDGIITENMPLCSRAEFSKLKFAIQKWVMVGFLGGSRNIYTKDQKRNRKEPVLELVNFKN